MLGVSVDLGSIKVAGKRPNLSLTLSSSCSIILPPSWPATPTAEELCHASANGKVWISKTGSCQIDVLSLVNGEVPDSASLDASIMAAIASFPSECPVWQHTGLELRTNHASHARPDQSRAQASYFLHHPNLSSEMIAPTNVPSAQFEGLGCEVNYSFGSAKSQTRSKPSRPKQTPPDALDLTGDAEESPAIHTYRLRGNPRRSRKAVVAQEEMVNLGPSSSSTSSFQFELGHDNGEQEDLESLVSEAIADMAHLLDFAFRKLLGVKGSSPGLRTVKSMVSPSLIDIAPAVWDLQYLQTMAVHAQVIPSISAGISRLRNARSASLREKVDTLTRRGALGEGSQRLANTEADATDEVKKRLWLLCQTRIRPEPIKGPCVTRKADQNAVEQAPSQLVLAEQELRVSPLYIDGLDGNSLVDMESYDLVADHDPYATLPEVLPGHIHPETGSHPPADGPHMLEEGGPSSDEWTPSSEGDYFYTDGQGNVYPVERQAVPEADQIEWTSNRQLLGSGELYDEDEDELEEHWDGGANQTYIMYHEAQHWPPVAGVHMHPEDVPDHPFPLRHPGDAPSSYWAGD